MSWQLVLYPNIYSRRGSFQDAVLLVGLTNSLLLQRGEVGWRATLLRALSYINTFTRSQEYDLYIAT